MEIEERKERIDTGRLYTIYSLTLNGADLNELVAKEDILRSFSESEAIFQLDLLPCSNKPKAQTVPNSALPFYHIQSVGGYWDYKEDSVLIKSINSWGKLPIYYYEIPIGVGKLAEIMRESGLQISSAAKPVIIGYVELKYVG
jgi:hypothetical protein